MLQHSNVKSLLVACAALAACGCASMPAGAPGSVFDVVSGWRWNDDFLMDGGLIGAAIGLGLAVIGNGKGWLGGIVFGALVGWFVALVVLTS